MGAGVIRVRSAVIAVLVGVWCASGAGAQPQSTEPSETTDWLTTITKLRYDLSRWPERAHLRQQLAIAYNNYAISLGEQKQWASAVEQLEEAIRLDSSNDQFRHNLGRVHLNQAVQAFEAHQLQEAKTAVQQALAADSRLAQAYTLLGEIEYHSQRLKEAKAAWQRALELEPNQPEVTARLRQVSQELPVESKFERLTQAYFDLRYEEQLERPAGFDIRDALLQARREVGSDFAYWPKHKIVTLIYSAQQFRALRQETPDWVAGQFDGKIRVPLPNGQLDPATVKQILFHEYTHALIHDLAAGKCPTWLNEGLAEYEGRKHLSAPLVQLAQAVHSDHLIPWDALSDHFSASLSVAEVTLAYQQSFSLAAYLVERYGFWRIRNVLKAIAQGHPWETVLAEQFHTKLARLERDWRSWLPGFLDNS